jgi:hypothetical protein
MRQARGMVLAAVAVVMSSPLSAQVTTTLSGEVRLRSEASRGATVDAWDNWTLQRSRLGLLAGVTPSVRAFVQVQDARVFGEEPTTLHGNASTFDLHQGWLEVHGRLGSAPVSVRAGRQELILGNERLVGAVGWSNTGRSFDAARLTAATGSGTLSGGAFLATVHEGGARYGATNGANLGSDHWFGGVYGGTKAVEAYVLYDEDAHYGVYREVDRATAGLRLQSPAARRLTGSVEAAYQVGSQLAGGTAAGASQDIAAYFAGVRVGASTGVKLVPSLGAGVDYLSGDDDVLDGDYGAFNTLYATNHKFYGYIDLFLDPAARTRGRGLVDALVSAKAGLGRVGTLEVDLHNFQLAEQAGLSGRTIGWELDLTLPVRITEGLRVTTGYSLFRNGEAAPGIGLGADGRTWHWGFVQASVQF